jgi:hypothetical protein
MASLEDPVQRALDPQGVFQVGHFWFGKANFEVVFQQKHQLDVFQRVPGWLARAGRILLLADGPAQDVTHQAMNLQA